MHDIVTKAKYFAIAAHEAVGQKRKYTGEPYWHHPERVAATVEEYGGSPEQIAAAWLHDTVEDTGVELSTIQEMFGSHVADLVSDLTDISTPEDGNRKTRKLLDLHHTAGASPEAKTIKLADLIDNTICIVKHDKKFAETYLKEKALLMEVLTEGDVGLYKRAQYSLLRSQALMK